MGEQSLAVGLMSGTSADGIDAALVEFIEGSGSFPKIRLLDGEFTPFEPSFRARILAATRPDVPLSELGPLDRELGERFALAALSVIKRAGLAPDQVRVVGSHGQTVAHYPNGPHGYTVQIGNPAVIAARTGIDVASDFRMMDVALGGQGAPLVPYVDYALLSSDAEHRVLLNIGGIANVTVLRARGAARDVLGFDTGPGNMVIDAAVDILSGGREMMDRDGAWAARGAVDPVLLQDWLEHPYFALNPPKSAGREQFGRSYVLERLRDGAHREPADILRTLTALVAESIARGIRGVIDEPHALIASGGGASNPTLMHDLSQRLSLLRPWETSAAFGIPADLKEAVAFAYLAHQLAMRRPTSLPGATGAIRAHLQGSMTPARF